ncbi:hypothetical protein E2C01_083245 [Portunus trituberculatus]|uniref:Uncharacterized protein n=1 Tax=Portunus trituberculatus TaxID=210409 RepID=A0A5B7J0N9_PORTR|nr:hypothetical protein [Portunus trituberculatus]
MEASRGRLPPPGKGWWRPALSA